MSTLTLTAIPGIPAVRPGDDIASITLGAMSKAGIECANGDVLVFAQKIISKAENRYAYLNAVQPSDEALTLARQADKDPRLVELILSESVAVLRYRPGVIVVEHRCGYVLANAGIDRSNIQSDPNNPRVLLLPEDSDLSAAQMKDELSQASGKEVSVIINDSLGRAWRNGTVGIALGTAGFDPLENLVGNNDMFGRPMIVTEVAVADELSAAASFLMGQKDEATPVIHIRGAQLRASEQDSRRLIREKDKDLFR